MKDHLSLLARGRILEPPMGPARALRLLQTVRYLKPVQIYGRALQRLPCRRPDDTSPGLRVRSGTWTLPVTRPRTLLSRWTARFLNEDGETARAEQWNDPAKPKLWLYNLHYFDDLCSTADAQHHALQRELVSRWIAENPPGHGNGWEPYPVSLRIANWIKWALAGADLEPHWLQSLAQQTRWLTRRIEWHLLGNHLLANAKALVLAGLFFDGPEAEHWLTEGRAIYARELPEQILSDGGHFELSPMYHAIILEDLLDLINAARTYGRAYDNVFRDIPAIITRMRFWLAAMTHPDGELSFFNDAAFGIAPGRGALEAYAQRLGLPQIAEPSEGVHRLRASGYVRVNQGDLSAILDLAAVGPDYIPGHAHADTLSFELSLGSERILVNGGTSTYSAGPLREAQRATRSHNTVEVGGRSSSDVWASFRVGRRARVRECSVVRKDGAIVVSGMHDGYRHLRGRPVHRRTWTFGATTLAIRDEILGATPLQAVARFIVSPALRATAAGSAIGLTTAAGRTVSLSSSSPPLIEDCAWYPEFGKAVPARAITAPLREAGLRTALAWS